MLHDWPESYFKVQQSKGDGLAGIFKQAMGQHHTQKIAKTRSIMARMFPSSPLARLKSLAVRTFTEGCVSAAKSANHFVAMSARLCAAKSANPCAAKSASHCVAMSAHQYVAMSAHQYVAKSAKFWAAEPANDRASLLDDMPNQHSP